MAASTRTRTSFRSTPRTSCSSAAGRSRASSRWSGSAPGKGSRSLGFGGADKTTAELEAERQSIISDVTHDDLLQFGLIPEFVGRLPVVSVLDPLDVDMMMMILTEPKNAVARQFQRLFSMDDVELIFSEEARRANRGGGARVSARVRAVCERSSRSCCST